MFKKVIVEKYADGTILCFYLRQSEKMYFSGRMMFPSKSSYEGNPVFNSVFFVKDSMFKIRKIWHGDIDLDEDKEALQGLSDVLGTDVYVLKRDDSEWRDGNKPSLKKAVAVFRAGADGWQ